MAWKRRIVAGTTVVVLLIAAAVVYIASDHSTAFRDCSDCPQMVPLPPGTFVMGVPPGEEERENVPPGLRGSSVPQHQVAISNGIALGRYDVTRAEFAAFVRETNYQTGVQCWIFALDSSDNRWKFQEKSGFDWRSPGFTQTDRDPVVCVSWNDAKAYASWLSRRTGKTYRLPTEAEWEYAARAGSPSVRFWGDERTQACRYANVADLAMAGTFNSQRDPERFFMCSDGFTYTAPVGSFEANAFGLYDMLGNVWQWTEDCWNQGYRGAPADGSAWTTGDCGHRVGRGGAWFSLPWFVRVGSRDRVEAGFRATSNGFRVARTQ